MKALGLQLPRMPTTTCLCFHNALAQHTMVMVRPLMDGTTHLVLATTNSPL
jgi:hypothetical protein